jgi:oxygen-independent coproporphyrinogen-3 oxidase
MPSSLPGGEPVPPDGSLPNSSYAALGERPFGVYVHIPFCAVRCGYCDFNTYTATELARGASRDAYAGLAIKEIRLARSVLGDRDLPVETVFFGGGTPTLLAPDDLTSLLRSIGDEFGLADDAEVTVEANPDSVDAASLAQLRAAGINRISFGMQSHVPHVLRTLERTHDPTRLGEVVDVARSAGFEQVSVDLIYGTPGETLADWQTSIEAAVGLEPDHVSAYALIVEPGTRLAARIRRGEVAAPDDDDQADKYVLADELLAAAGFEWYEVSNWATGAGAQSRHNMGYWLGHDWWGVGPGAHSHVAGTRWWNVKHPTAYAERLAPGTTPAHAREVLDAESRRLERILLATRLRDGQPLEDLRPAGRRAAERARSAGLLAQSGYDNGRATLTLRGRLLADAVVRDLVD